MFWPLEHFPGDNDHKRAATFLDKVDALKAYKEKRGHFRVLRKDRNLYGFCHRVIRARSGGRKFGTAKLNKHRIAALDPIGFDWEMQGVDPASGTLTGPLIHVYWQVEYKRRDVAPQSRKEAQGFFPSNSRIKVVKRNMLTSK